MRPGTVMSADGMYWFCLPAKRHSIHSEFDIEKIDALPFVKIAYGHSNFSATTYYYHSFTNAWVKATLHARTGNASVSSNVVPALQICVAKGCISSVHHAPMPMASSCAMPISLMTNNWILAHDLNPQKARILASVALSTTKDSRELQQI